MNIAIFGAGAIGSYLAVRLHQAGANVSVIARGSQLTAIKANGLTLISDGERATVHPFATSDAREAGTQDYVFVALKAHTVLDAAADIAVLLKPETGLITAMNGIPYWYFYRANSPWEDRRIESVDPGGVLWRLLPPNHAIGCVLYPWAQILEPGVAEQSVSNRFVIGEPDGMRSARIETLAKIMQRGTIDAPITAHIRDEIWLKLWGNLSMNPLSALTGATIGRLASEADLRAVARQMMVEAQGVAEALGVRFPIAVEERIDIGGLGGARKTSMLQDLELGRTLEIEPLLGAVVELANLVDHKIPLCRTVLALTRERARRARAAAR